MKFAASLLAVCIASGSVEAQVTGLDIGATAGVNFATVAGDDTDGAKNLVGFMAGVSFITRVTDMVSFQPEIAYSRKGSKIEADGETGDIKLTYIDIPLLAKFSLGGASGPARPALYLGPYGAVNIGCDIKAEGVAIECDEFDLEPKTFDFGLVAGAGLDFGSMNVFARYQFGLTNVGDDADAGDAKNRVIQVGARFSFRGK